MIAAHPIPHTTPVPDLINALVANGQKFLHSHAPKSSRKSSQESEGCYSKQERILMPMFLK